MKNLGESSPRFFLCTRINKCMIPFIVRGPNWKISIDIEDSLEPKYQHVKAATRAIERLYEELKKDDTLGISPENSEDRPKFTTTTQVCKKEYDVEFPTPEVSEEDAEKINEKIKRGFIQFIFTPKLLANAGQFERAEFLKGIIEKR